MRLSLGDTRVDGHLAVGGRGSGDVVSRLDRSLPFATGSVEAIVVAGVLDRLTRPEGVRVLRECRRLLRPGGHLRVLTADLDAVLAAAGRTEPDPAVPGNTPYVPTRAERLDAAFRGRGFVYDADEVRRIGRIAGFEPAPAPAADAPAPAAGQLAVDLVSDLPAPRDGAALVSVLVPAYRATFLDEALRSARDQTWPNVEILVGDDCPDDSVAEVVARHAAADPRIAYERVGPGAGSLRNYLRLYERATGEYVKFLNDDDLLAPHCVERMARCLDRLPRVSVVTSHRRRIDVDGTPLPDCAATALAVAFDAVIEGPTATDDMLRRELNWIGEPTTGLFRRADIDDVEPTLFSFAGRRCEANVDVTLWTRLLSRGDLVYLTESLSSFRQHPDQEQRTYEDFANVAARAWAQIQHDARAMGLVDDAGLPQLAARPLEMKPWWAGSVTDAVLAADGALAVGDVDAALAALDDAHDLAPGEVALALMRANLLHAVGRTAEAFPILTRLLVSHPDHVETLLAQAQIALDIGELAEAEALVAVAAARVPRDTSLRMRLQQLQALAADARQPARAG